MNKNYLTWLIVCAVLAGLFVSCFNPIGSIDPGANLPVDNKAILNIRLGDDVDRTIFPTFKPFDS